MSTCATYVYQQLNQYRTWLPPIFIPLPFRIEIYHKRAGLELFFLVTALLWNWSTVGVSDSPVRPRVQLSLGSNLQADSIKEGDDVYFDCRSSALPAVTRLEWYQNVGRSFNYFESNCKYYPTFGPFVSVCVCVCVCVCGGARKMLRFFLTPWAYSRRYEGTVVENLFRFLSHSFR